MRVISGKYKGYRFPDKGLKDARPTTDRAKESLFNILDQRYHFDRINVLDLYSGSGGIALEFESRGCTDIEAVEWNRSNVQYIRNTCDKLGAKLNLIQQKVIPFLQRSAKTYDVIFGDPPYRSTDYAEIVALVKERGLLKDGGILILEHETGSVSFPVQAAEERVYGQSTFSFFTFDSES